MLLATDITERRRSERRFRALLDSAPDAMIVANQDGELVQVNTETERLLKYTRKELVERRLEWLIPSDLSRGHSTHREQYFADPEVRTMGAQLELRGKFSDGKEFLI